MRRFALALSLPFALLFGACEGDDGLADAVIVTDTVELATPTSALQDLPTALDANAATGVLIAGRFPEEEVDAEEWDLALRLVAGELVFVPAGKVGIRDVAGVSSAGITEPLAGKTFEALDLAPAASAYVTDANVPLRLGNVHAVRTRFTACSFSASQNFAKIQLLDVDVAQQRVKLQIAANENCGDRRLVEED